MERRSRFLKSAGKIYPKLVIITLIIFVFKVLTPDESTSKTMVGAYAVQKTAEYATTIEGIDSLPKEILDAAKGYLNQLKKTNVVEETPK